MGRFILLYGKSGSGKSRSLKNFGDDEIYLVNVIGKEMPFRKRFKYVSVTASIDTIIAGLQRMPCKTAVIDDAGYLMTSQFMAGHSQPKKGSNSFDLYNDIADGMWKLINAIKALPDDVNVYVVMHEDTNDYGDTRLRTIGKLLNDKICVEGMSTVVLRCVTMGNEHFFRTRTDGSDITKSPEDMFEDEKIENDLALVDRTIREYYNETGEADGQ
jgi:energy-coupling factor transporter ATP-binding protein EcfA2